MGGDLSPPQFGGDTPQSRRRIGAVGTSREAQNAYRKAVALARADLAVNPIDDITMAALVVHRAMRKVA